MQAGKFRSRMNSVGESRATLPNAAGGAVDSGENADFTMEFDSLFESGNLEGAIRVRDDEYHLLMQTDTNTYGYNQWFYFRVRWNVPWARANARKTAAGVRILHFKLMNFTKPHSLFS